MERGTRDLEERFGALQDEVDLLKSEVKQTLVDLREFMMKERTIFPQAALSDGAPQEQQPVPVPLSPSIAPVPDVRRQAPPQNLQSQVPPSSGTLDVAMMGNIIRWLGTVKRSGLSFRQLSPFLDAYEAAGYLKPATAKLILRSMADLDDLEETPSNQAFSAQDYVDCLGQLHDIICTPEYTMDRLAQIPRAQQPELTPKLIPSQSIDRRDFIA